MVHAERLPISTFTVEDGLPSDRVMRIVTDSRGFLWSCHRSGLGRFDGQRFRAYGPQHGLPVGSTRDLLETDDGDYLIGTSKGIYRLEPKADDQLFVALSPTDATPPSILALEQDQSGTIWAGATSGLFRVAVDDDVAGYDRVELPDGGIRSQGSSYVFDLVAGQDGSLWIATRSGLVHRTAAGELRRYHRSDGLPGDDLRCLLRDPDGQIWVGGTEGLARLGPAPMGSGTIAAEVLLPGPDLPSDFVQALHMTGDGTIWLGSDGVAAITRQGGIWSGARRYSTLNGLAQNAITALAEDSSGNLWIGTESAGLMRLTRGGLVSFAELEGLARPRISSLLETGAGELCVTTSDSFFLLRDGRFEPIEVHLPGRLTWGWYQIVLQDHLGGWWFATTRGLARFPAVDSVEGLNGARPIAVYGAADGLATDHVFRLYEDSRGDLWIGTISETARVQLARWNRTTGQFHRFTAADGLPIHSPTAFREDQHGQLWIGFYDGGLARYRGGRFEMFGGADGIPSGQVRALHLDRDGQLWAAISRAGLVRIDDPGAAKPAIHRLTTADGLASQSVTAIVEDRQGRLYFGTDRGIDRYDRSTGRFWHYGKVDGLPNSFVNVAHRDQSGSLWFGTLQGLARLEPHDDQTSSAPPIFIDRVRIAGRDHPVSELGESTVASVQLDHRQDRVQIEYGALGYRAGSVTRFQHRLLGADSTWSEPQSTRSVDYANLAPGSYRFEVQAVDASGQASSEPASFSFWIAAPLWRRGWFLSLVTALVAAVVVTGYAARVRSLKARHRELARMVAVRTADLSAAKAELEDHSRTLEKRVASGIDALREAEQMAAYGNLVAGVAHEVRHPIFSLQAAAFVLTDKLRGTAGLERQLRVLDRETARMSALMDDLLEFARPAELTVEPTDLGRVMKEAVETYRAAHPEETLQVILEVADDLPRMEIDTRRMLQVLINLMENARKHAEGITTIRLTAAVEAADTDSRTVVVNVSNDGAPIPREVLPRIFEPFFSGGRGTGLGLAIVRRIVGEHGGKIEVRSTDDTGTSFKIALPV